MNDRILKDTFISTEKNLKKIISCYVNKTELSVVKFEYCILSIEWIFAHFYPQFKLNQHLRGINFVTLHWLNYQIQVGHNHIYKHFHYDYLSFLKGKTFIFFLIIEFYIVLKLVHIHVYIMLWYELIVGQKYEFVCLLS